MTIYSEQASLFATRFEDWDRQRLTALRNRVRAVADAIHDHRIAPSDAVADLVAACAEHDGRVRS